MKESVVETRARIEVLEDRFDRHLDRVEKKLDEIHLMQNTINEKITAVRIDAIRQDRDTNIKIYTVNGVIAALVSFLTAMVMTFVKAR